MESYQITKLAAARLLGMYESELNDWNRRFGRHFINVRSNEGDETQSVDYKSYALIEIHYEYYSGV